MVPKKVKGLRATRIFAAIASDVRWCDNCGIPILSQNRCRCCGSRTRKVKLVPPGDVRIAFDYDIELLRRTIEKCIGRRAVAKLVPDNSFVLLNKVQGVDVAYEVIVDGYSVGELSYDPWTREWLFKPMYYGARIVVEEDVGAYIVVNKIVPGKVVAREEVLEAHGDVSGKFVVALSSDGKVVGLAKRVSKGFAIVKRWTLDSAPKLRGRGTDIRKVIEGNIERLRELERVAVERIEKAKKLGRVFVTVSGGKDSSVAAYIASLCGVRDFVFVDTGLELPETYAQVEKLEKVLGCAIDRIGDPKAFWREIKILGPPARDYRWCSRVCKLAHISKWCRSRGCNVSVVGQRRYESISRALSSPIAKSGSTARGFVVAPIHEWCSLEVTLYSYYRGIPLNELYRKGFDRVGCFMCPTSRLAEFAHVEEVHRDVWQEWVLELEMWRRKWGLPREWIDLGLWRWRFSYPAEMRYIAKLRGVSVDEVTARIVNSYARASIAIEGNRLRIVVSVRGLAASMQRLAGALYAVGLGMPRLVNSELEVCKNGEYSIKAWASGIEIEVSANAKRDRVLSILRRSLKAWFFSTKCSGCGLCESICHRGAVRLGVIDVEKCSSCARCVFICPHSMAAENVVEAVSRELSLKS